MYIRSMGFFWSDLIDTQGLPPTINSKLHGCCDEVSSLRILMIDIDTFRPLYLKLDLRSSFLNDRRRCVSCRWRFDLDRRRVCRGSFLRQPVFQRNICQSCFFRRCREITRRHQSAPHAIPSTNTPVNRVGFVKSSAICHMMLKIFKNGLNVTIRKEHQD